MRKLLYAAVALFAGGAAAFPVTFGPETFPCTYAGTMHMCTVQVAPATGDGEAPVNALLLGEDHVAEDRGVYEINVGIYQLVAPPEPEPEPEPPPVEECRTDRHGVPFAEPYPDGIVCSPPPADYVAPDQPDYAAILAQMELIGERWHLIEGFVPQDIDDLTRPSGGGWTSNVGALSDLWNDPTILEGDEFEYRVQRTDYAMKGENKCQFSKQLRQWACYGGGHKDSNDNGMRIVRLEPLSWSRPHGPYWVPPVSVQGDNCVAPVGGPTDTGHTWGGQSVWDSTYWIAVHQGYTPPGGGCPYPNFPPAYKLYSYTEADGWSYVRDLIVNERNIVATGPGEPLILTGAASVQNLNFVPELNVVVGVGIQDVFVRSPVNLAILQRYRHTANMRESGSSVIGSTLYMLTKSRQMWTLDLSVAATGASPDPGWERREDLDPPAGVRPSGRGYDRWMQCFNPGEFEATMPAICFSMDAEQGIFVFRP